MCCLLIARCAGWYPNLSERAFENGKSLRAAGYVGNSDQLPSLAAQFIQGVLELSARPRPGTGRCNPGQRRRKRELVIADQQGFVFPLGNWGRVLLLRRP